jgi:adenylate cyclase
MAPDLLLALMPPPATTSSNSATTDPRRRWALSLLTRVGRSFQGLYAIFRRWPFASFFGIVIISNAFGSYFNIQYNHHLIIARLLDSAQARVFYQVALPVYNGIAYPLCLGLVLYLLWPLMRCRRALLTGREVTPAELERCRQRLVNMPFHAVWINLLGWLPGMLFFPLVILWLGGTSAAGDIWFHFCVSFVVSALLTTVQTFCLVDIYLIRVLYPDFFQDERPAAVRNVLRVSFGTRLLLLWAAVALMPLIALVTVAFNIDSAGVGGDSMRRLAAGVAVVGILSGGVICAIVGLDLLGWVDKQAEATEQVALGNFDFRIPELRPDEWGRLTDGFNDMTAALTRARRLRETFGQMVSPDVRDEVMENYPGLGGAVQEVTVLFADIRGFTRRTAGEAPERIVDLLNRFLSLAVAAVEGEDGFVKFLGDGIMALFNAPRRRADHADRAVSAARALLTRLAELNAALAAEYQAALEIGVGIHTGLALVGCIGATLTLDDGRQQMRREFTAIGETVNLGQRIEQLTKQCGGPLLLSEPTRARLLRRYALEDLGAQDVPGLHERLVVHRVSPT